MFLTIFWVYQTILPKVNFIHTGSILSLLYLKLISNFISFTKSSLLYKQFIHDIHTYRTNFDIYMKTFNMANI